MADQNAIVTYVGCNSVVGGFWGRFWSAVLYPLSEFLNGVHIRN